MRSGTLAFGGLSSLRQPSAQSWQRDANFTGDSAARAVAAAHLRQRAAVGSQFGLTPRRARCVGAGRQLTGAVVAMAKPRRTQRVSQQIMRELSLLMLSDKRVRSAMSPEERLGADTRLTTLASVTEVVISGDLQVAKVYVSFFGDERRSTLAFSGLQRLEGYLRSQVGKAMQLRFVPELRFFRDEGAERGGRVLNLLSGLRDGESPALAASDIDSEDSDFFEEEEDNSDVELIQYSSEESDGDIIMVHSDGEVST